VCSALGPLMLERRACVRGGDVYEGELVGGETLTQASFEGYPSINRVVAFRRRKDGDDTKKEAWANLKRRSRG